MMKANELKKGMLILVDDLPVLINKVVVQSPSSRSGTTLYKVSGRNVSNKTKYEQSFKGGETIIVADYVRRSVQLLYQDADSCTLMDEQSYEQYVITKDNLVDELPFIIDGLTGLQAILVDDVLVGLELPATVTLTIIECSPAIKGATAAARTKPATTTTGLIVQVPEYLQAGELIKVNTETGEYMSRA